MRLRFLSLVFAAAMVPMAQADSTPQQPKYPPAWDCSAAPAGSQRQACNRSQLNPPMGTIPDTKSTVPPLVIPEPQVPVVPTGRPPGVPPLPGTIDNGN